MGIYRALLLAIALTSLLGVADSTTQVGSREWYLFQEPNYISGNQQAYYLGQTYLAQSWKEAKDACNAQHGRLYSGKDPSFNIKDFVDRYWTHLFDGATTFYTAIDTELKGGIVVCEAADYQCPLVPGMYIFLARDTVRLNHPFISVDNEEDAVCVCTNSNGASVTLFGQYALPKACEPGLIAYMEDYGFDESTAKNIIHNIHPLERQGSLPPLCIRNYVRFSGSFQLVWAPNIGTRTHYNEESDGRLVKRTRAYSYSQAKTICEYHGMRLPTTDNHYKLEVIFDWSAHQELWQQTSLWNISEPFHSDEHETRPGILCQVPPVDIICDQGASFFFPFDRNYDSIKSVRTRPAASRACLARAGFKADLRLIDSKCFAKLNTYYGNVHGNQLALFDFQKFDSPVLKPVLCMRPRLNCASSIIHVFSTVPANPLPSHSYSYRDATEICQQQGLVVRDRDTQDERMHRCTTPFLTLLTKVLGRSFWDMSDTTISTSGFKQGIMCTNQRRD